MLEPTNGELIDALNLLCEHVERKLPGGYSIEVSMSKEEATMELFDQGGEPIEFETEYLISGVNSAIRAAIDHVCESA